MRAFVIHDKDGNILSVAVPATNLEQGNVEVRSDEGFSVTEIDIGPLQAAEHKAATEKEARARAMMNITQNHVIDKERKLVKRQTPRG